MGCLFGYCGPAAPELLPRMAALLAHRCAKGWERVSMTLADGTTVAIGHGIAPWSGAAQVAQDSERVLGFAGALFNGGGQTDTLLTGLDDAGCEIRLPDLEGAFVLALARNRTFYLLRDHAGVKAVYWTLHHGRLLFASEIKALFAQPELARRLRPGALAEYLSFSFVPGRRTMFEGIEELQPGTLLRFSDARVDVQRHFRFERCEGMAIGKDHAGALRAALETSVQECCRVSRSTPGVFLSGGIDSSSVLALTARTLSDARIPTFSVFFGEEYPHENPFIELMVERYRTEHHALEIRPEQFLDSLHEIIWCLDDPIGDPVAMPNYLMARKAAEVTDVILNGEGGDPCLGGPKNVPMLLTRLYGPASDESTTDWLERSYLHSFQRCYRDLEELLDPELLRAAGGEEALVDIIKPFFETAPPRAFLNKLMAMNIRLKGANLILVKVDKMTSANGLLALPPLFSRRVIETSMACPPYAKLVGGVEKHVLKQAVRDIVPQAIIDRPKSGMMVPVRFWFQGELRRYARKKLSPRYLKQIGLFRPDYVKKILAYDMQGVRGQRHGLKLWMLITFIQWYEQMVEAPPERFRPDGF